MLFLIIALVSIVASLVFARMLAMARVKQTGNPFPVRGPSLGSVYPANRANVSAQARDRRMLGAEVHLN